MKKSYWLVLATAGIVSAAFMLFSSRTLAGDLTGYDIVKKSDDTQRSKDEFSVVNMEIKDRRGDIRKRELHMYFKAGADENDKLFVRILEPSDVRGFGFLTLEKSDGEDDQWIYLPAKKRIKRIAGGGRKDSFVGSDFFYADMRTENLKAYKYTLVRKETVNGKPCYLVEAVPATAKEKKETGYSKRELWIHTDEFYVVKINYYNLKGKLYKVQTNSEYVKDSGLWRPNQVEMKNLKKRSRTLLVYKSRKINKGIPDRRFSRRELERGR
jgi:outer membrane lipoprotein-sorting protein